MDEGVGGWWVTRQKGISGERRVGGARRTKRPRTDKVSKIAYQREVVAKGDP